ncbi:ankyrin repeat domain-containing protein 50-like [Haliotis rufescens]|uniref:ankyrin repeat domain-containing protein 50-like n=1 Tax=Haliotis rufescens TaxID=6454 RepID=UPI00201FA0EF|nr:ankyrin repeat domain-containing protein 50-like [Haliotis rufescens]
MVQIGIVRRCENNVERNDYMPVSNEGILHVSRDVRGLLKRPIASTLLHKASGEGNLDLAKEILNGGLLNVNTRGSYGLTPLMWAALNGHYYVFEYLKQEGGDMTLKDSDGDSILSMACVGGNMDIVKYVFLREPTLINRQRSDGRTALMWAASRGNTTVFEYLLDRKATPSLDDNDGNNILHYACYGGHIDIVKCVIDQTTLNINTSDLLGRTALMIAATYGHKEVFDLLVGKDSDDISHKDKEGNNILHAACRGGHVEMVKHILSQGLVDINSQGQEGKTPLLLAVHWEQGAVFNLLVSRKADLLQVDYNGNNILHLACEIGSMEIVKYVMSQKSLDIKARNIQGETASMVAKRKHHMDLYNFLVSKEG